MFKRITAALSALMIAANMFVFCFAAGYTTIIVHKKDTVALTRDGAEFTTYKGAYSKDGNELAENAYAVSAKLGKNLFIDVANSGAVYGRSTLSSQMNNYPLAEDDRVIAAINADFFSSVTGIPLGIQISGGVLQTTNDKNQNHYAIGFKEDGSAIIAKPELTIKALFSNKTLEIDYVNKHPGFNTVLLSSDYADKTYWSAIPHDVIVLNKSSNVIKIGEGVTCVFEEYLTNQTEPIEIKDEYWYIIAPTAEKKFTFASELVLGDIVAVQVTEPTGEWKNVTTAVSGGDLLVKDGKVVNPSSYDSAISRKFTSRSAIGIRADGSIVMYAVEKDKNGAYSGGVYIEAVSQALVNMGCVTALNLDGGGSTTIAAAKDSDLVIRNRLQDGYERKIGNSLLLVYSPDSPVVLDDFEEDTNLLERYDGLNLVTAQREKENSYTGKAAIKAEYRLEPGATVGFDFEKEYEVLDYTVLNAAVLGDGAGTEIELVLNNSFADFTEKLTTVDFEGYKRVFADVKDAYVLKGINIKNTSDKNIAGTLYFDRLIGSVYQLTDVTPPTVNTWVNKNMYYARVTNGLTGSGVDPLITDITVNGERAEPFFRNDVFSFGIENTPKDKVNLAIAEVSDIIGNRSRNMLLFTNPAYNVKMPFADASDGKWDSNYIRYCFENGYVAGIKQGDKLNFGGALNITRAEFCTMLVKRSGLDVTKYLSVKLPYEDVDDIPAWALLYVKAAYAEGVMVGGGKTFNPNSNITRAEAACAANNIAKVDLRLTTTNEFTDGDTIPDWAKTGVKTATEQGIFKGDEKGRFNPKNLLTRSEAAVIMTHTVI